MTLSVSILCASNCGGNCPNNLCPSCPCGITKKIVNLGSFCNKYNWNQVCCHCIVQKETGANANFAVYNNGAYSVGIFKIPQMFWEHCSENKPPCDPDTNTECGIMVYNSNGNTWKAWSSARACGCDN